MVISKILFRRKTIAPETIIDNKVYFGKDNRKKIDFLYRLSHILYEVIYTTLVFKLGASRIDDTIRINNSASIYGTKLILK